MQTITDLQDVVAQNNAYLLKMAQEKPYPARAIVHCKEQTRLIQDLIDAHVSGDPTKIAAARNSLDSWGKVYATASMLSNNK